RRCRIQDQPVRSPAPGCESAVRARRSRSARQGDAAHRVRVLLLIVLHDAHCHFFSARFFEALGRERRRDAAAAADAIAGELGWDPPGSADALTDRWIAELTRHHVGRAALMASVPGDEESVAAAVAKYPDRLVGYFALNPTMPDAVERATRAFGQGLRCACLFPAMHRYRLTDEKVAQIFEIAAAHDGAIFVHCGYLSIEARVKLGLASKFDLRLGDPLAVAAMAAQFPR